MTDEQAHGEAVGMGSAENDIATLTNENATLRARLEASEKAAYDVAGTIEHLKVKLEAVERERDEAIRLARVAAYDALLSAGHTKDEHTAAVFGQWKQAIDDALKAEARVRELENLEGTPQCWKVEHMNHDTLTARCARLEEVLEDTTSKLEYILARTKTVEGSYTFPDGDTWPASQAPTPAAKPVDKFKGMGPCGHFNCEGDHV